jgi:hypothetical protein
MIKIKKQSKPISELKKGDKIFIDGKAVIVDAHYLFIKHKTTTEMIIEVYSEKTEKDYQIRYFDDQIETSLEFYALENDFQYTRKEVNEIEW